MNLPFLLIVSTLYCVAILALIDIAIESYENKSMGMAIFCTMTTVVAAAIYVAILLLAAP